MLLSVGYNFNRAVYAYSRLSAIEFKQQAHISYATKVPIEEEIQRFKYISLQYYPSVLYNERPGMRRPLIAKKVLKPVAIFVWIEIMSVPNFS